MYIALAIYIGISVFGYKQLPPWAHFLLYLLMGIITSIRISKVLVTDKPLWMSSNGSSKHVFSVIFWPILFRFSLLPAFPDKFGYRSKPLTAKQIEYLKRRAGIKDDEYDVF